MSRNLTQGEELERLEAIPAEDIEELGDEAIIAQQSQAHLPQKRINVQDELPSIVIASEPVPVAPTSSRRPAPYRGDEAAATLVMRDRRELEAMRKKALAMRQQAPQRGGMGPLVWAALAVAAFAAGGLVTLLIVRGTSGPREISEARTLRESRPRPSREVRSATPGREPPTPQVKLEELPLEKPAR